MDDVLSFIIEEVGFDGFEGCSLPRLWNHLEVRDDIELDDMCKDYIFKIIKKCPHFKFYHITEPAELVDGLFPVAPTDIKHELGTLISKREPLDLDSIEDLPVESIETIYGDSFVIVASLEIRWQLLTENRINYPDLSAYQYVLLERIGYFREEGARQSELAKAGGIAPRNLFAPMKKFEKIELITRFDDIRTTNPTVICALKRFPGGANNWDSLRKKLCDGIAEFGDRELTIAEVKQVIAANVGVFLQKRSFRNRVKTILRMLSNEEILVEIEPGAFRLLKMPQQKAKHTNKKTDVEEFNAEKFNVCLDMSYARQAFEMTIRSGEKGTTQMRIGEELGISKRNTSRLCDYLEKICGVSRSYHSVGRASEYRYFFHTKTLADTHRFIVKKNKKNEIQGLSDGDGNGNGDGDGDGDDGGNEGNKVVVKGYNAVDGDVDEDDSVSNSIHNEIEGEGEQDEIDLEPSNLELLLHKTSTKMCKRCGTICDECISGYGACAECDFVTCYDCFGFLTMSKEHDPNHVVVFTDKETPLSKNTMAEIEKDGGVYERRANRYKLTEEHKVRCRLMTKMIDEEKVIDLAEMLKIAPKYKLPTRTYVDFKTRNRLLQTAHYENEAKLWRIGIVMLDGSFRMAQFVVYANCSIRNKIFQENISMRRDVYLVPHSKRNKVNGEDSHPEAQNSSGEREAYAVSGHGAYSVVTRLRFGWISARYYRCKLFHSFLWKLCFVPTKLRLADEDFPKDLNISKKTLKCNKISVSKVMDNLSLELFLQVLGLDEPSTHVQLHAASDDFRHTPLKDLPGKLCNDLLVSRSYGPRFRELVFWLSKLNLVEMADANTIVICINVTLQDNTKEGSTEKNYELSKFDNVLKWWRDLESFAYIAASDEGASRRTPMLPVAGFDKSLGLNISRLWRNNWTPKDPEKKILENYYKEANGNPNKLDFVTIGRKLRVAEFHIRNYFKNRPFKKYLRLPRSGALRKPTAAEREEMNRKRAEQRKKRKQKMLEEKQAYADKTDTEAIENIDDVKVKRRTYVWSSEEDHYSINCYIAFCVHRGSRIMNYANWTEIANAVNLHFPNRKDKAPEAYRSRMISLSKILENDLGIECTYAQMMNKNYKFALDENNNFNFVTAVQEVQDFFDETTSTSAFPTSLLDLKENYVVENLISERAFWESKKCCFTDQDWPYNNDEFRSFQLHELIIMILMCGTTGIKGLGRSMLNHFENLLEPVVRGLQMKRVIKKNKQSTFLPWPLRRGIKIDQAQLISPQQIDGYLESTLNLKELIRNKSMIIKEEGCNPAFVSAVVEYRGNFLVDIEFNIKKSDLIGIEAVCDDRYFDTLLKKSKISTKILKKIYVVDDNNDEVNVMDTEKIENPYKRSFCDLPEIKNFRKTKKMQIVEEISKEQDDVDNEVSEEQMQWKKVVEQHVNIDEYCNEVRPMMELELKDNGQWQEDIKQEDDLIKKTFRYIQNAGEMGLSILSLKKLIEKNLWQFLDDYITRELDLLIKAEMIYKVGRHSYRYVSYDNIKPWVVFKTESSPHKSEKTIATETEAEERNYQNENETENEIQIENNNNNDNNDNNNNNNNENDKDEEENHYINLKQEILLKSGNNKVKNDHHYVTDMSMSVVKRPWVALDGKINEEAWRSLSLSILDRVLVSPGISHNQLVKIMDPTLSSVTLRALLDIWESCGAVYHVSIPTPPAPTLFSNEESSLICPVENDSFFDLSEMETSWYPSVDARYRIARFLNK